MSRFLGSKRRILATSLRRPLTARLVAGYRLTLALTLALILALVLSLAGVSQLKAAESAATETASIASAPAETASIESAPAETASAEMASLEPQSAPTPLASSSLLASEASNGSETWSSPVVASLISPKVGDRDAAITALSTDDSLLASEILSALLTGRLFLVKDRGAFYFENQGQYVLAWPKTGPLTPNNPRKVAVNNRQRETIQRILGARALKDPDIGARRQASAALIGAPGVDLSLIRELIGSEADERTKDNLSLILALASLKDPLASQEDKLAALKVLTKLYAPAARDDLKSLSLSDNPVLATAAAQAWRSLEAKSQHLALAETFFFGLSLGSVLALIGIGLAITFGVMGVINMAHGEMAMLGAYTVWALQTIWPSQPGLALILALPAAFLVSGGVGAAIELSVIRPLYQRPLETLLATFGLSLILRQAVRKGISSMNVAVATPSFMSGQWQIGANFSLTQGRVFIFFFCLLVFLAVYLVLAKTRLGLEIRAVTQNRAMARALGVPSSRVDTMTFALGSGVAGVSGVALSQLTNVGPNLGQDYIVDSFMVVVFGGVGNLWGTLLGGFIIGLANKFLEPVNGAMLAKIVIMVGIIFFIQRHPKGLFPQKGRVTSF